MFSSTALFAEIDCPFEWGRCKRPYCLYSHGKDNTETDLGDLKVTAAIGASHTTDNHACLEELERINKEIEAVRGEVEKEQKRLSQYQSSQSLVHTECADVCSEKYLKIVNSQAEDQNGNFLRRTKPTSSTSVRKYVVDRARPKTDLEYDPYSNFSADLLSGSSVECKLRSTDKVDIEHGFKSNGTGEPLSSHFDDSDDERILVIDITPSEKGQAKRRAKLKGKTINKPLHSSEENLSIDNSLFENDRIKPWQQQERLFSEGSQSCDIINVVEQKKERTSGKPLTITIEQESSEGELVIDVSPLEDEHTLSKQCGTINKELLDSSKLCPSETLAEDSKEAKKEPSHKWVTIESQTKAFLEDSTEKPVAKLNISTNIETFVMHREEKAQNIENVLDDISTCLDNLRSESERIKSIQDIKLLPVTFVQGEEDISSKSAAGLVQYATFGVEPQIDCISSCAQKAEPATTKNISQEQGSSLQQYSPLVSSQSFTSSLLKNNLLGCGPHSQSLAETSWSTFQKSPVMPLVQNMPAYISGIDTGTVLSVPSTTPLKPRKAIEYEQKLFTSDVSFVSCEASVLSQTIASATMEGGNNESIVIDSSSEEELRYSDLELSETDPMEECYKIFMEASQKEAPVVQCVLPEALESPEIELKSNPPPVLKKRVAHVAKVELASKSKAQIIVPLQEAGSQLNFPSRSQSCQRRAAILTAAMKGCHSQVMSSAPKKVYTQSIIHPSAVQNSCVSVIPIGATLQLGANLHLIVPDGNCALPLTLIPTTMSIQRPQQPSPPMQLPQTIHPSQPPNYTPAKSLGVKRKAKIHHEVGVKVPHDVRQRYVNLFVEEFMKTSVTVQDAFEKALAEEKSVYDRSINKLKYLSVAVNALKRLKSQSVLPAKDPSERDQNVSRGNVPLNTRALQGPGDFALYEQLKEHVLSEDMLRMNNYPRKHQDKADVAIQYGDVKKGISDPLKRICCRCGATFSVDKSGKHTRREECNYHYGKVIENRVPGGVETRYSCCENAVGSPGCQVFNLHVHDAVSLQGFMSTLSQSLVGKTCPGVFAVDTQMCYTTQGLELARVTVVNSSLQVIFDTFVKPDNDVIDYNTRFSGISEDDVKGTSSCLLDVQAVLLSFINADTILIGHGLENDLAALKIIHKSVIDTSVVFPHRLGLPHKKELNSLTADYLRRIIQESAVGHDTREDATACMELMLWRVKEDSKVKRW